MPSLLTESGGNWIPRKITSHPLTKPLPVSVICIPTAAGFGVAADSEGSTSSDAGLLVSPPGMATSTSCHPLAIGGTSACRTVSAKNVVSTPIPPMLTTAAGV